MQKLLALMIITATATAHAESLEEKKYWKGQMDYVNSAIEKANKACDAKFTFDWVDKTKLRESAEKAHSSANGICEGMIDEVAALCSAGGDEKTAVKAKIKGFQCGYAKPRTLELNGGTLKYMGNNEESNRSEWAKPWLMKHL